MAGSQGANAVSVCEQLKGGYGIGEMFKKGVTREGGTEGSQMSHMVLPVCCHFVVMPVAVVCWIMLNSVCKKVWRMG
jgi:hypothetical protein